MFTCKIPSPYNLFCKVNTPPPINRSRTHVYAKYKRCEFPEIDCRMGTSSEMATLALTFEDVQGVYMMAFITGDLYSQHTNVIMDRHKRKLLPYKEFYWTIRVETTQMGVNIGRSKVELCA